MPLEIGSAWQRAWDGTARRLFRPFEFRTWLWLGFSAWLAGLLKQGYNLQVPGGWGEDAGGAVAEGGERLGRWLLDHLGCVLAVAIPLVLLLLVYVVVLSYLRARAEFVFLDQAVGGHLRFDVPWHASAREGKSLFLWRWGLVGVAAGSMALLVGLGVLLWLPARYGADAGLGNVVRVALTVPIVLAFFLVVLATVLAGFLTQQFVVPIMAKHHLTATAAWRRFLPLLRANAGGFALYVIVTLAVGMAVGMAVLFAGCMTCCIGFVLLAIPWLGTLPLLPALLFFRLLSVHYLAQLGPEYDLFAPAPAPAA
jgi:hypothetical protein